MRGLRRADSHPAAPVAAVHLGLGSFFRAHQAWYTDRAPDAAEWGIAAFTGRSPALAERLRGQGGAYALLERGASGPECSVVASLSEVHPAAAAERWLTLLATDRTRVVTLTVTEAAYLRADDGGLDRQHPSVDRDVHALRTGAREEAATVPGRLVAGLAARYDAGAGPLSVVTCDNLLHNGDAVRRVVLDLAGEVDDAMTGWIASEVDFTDSVVDRITPRTTEDDRRTVRRLLGVDDASPVVTEPFSEWILRGRFPVGRPAWDGAGATFVEDVTAFEQRKLWLLNGAHSLLAYAGSTRGHRTVAEAIADPRCRQWVEDWWDEAGRHVALDHDVLRDYREKLLDRFANPGIRHLLAQIAADGSQKLPMRVRDVLLAERRDGRMPVAGARIVAAWVAHLRGHGAPVQDPRAEELVVLAAGPPGGAVRRMLGVLAAALSDDDELVAVVTDQMEELVHQ